MRFMKFAGLLTAAVLFFTGASVWEGSAAAVETGDLPGGGYSVATNSFPRNSVIDITNLENGKTVRVIVVADLQTSGLLATLSRSSAEAIGLSENSVCRIRMTQPSDDIAFSRYREGPLPSAAPDAEITGPLASMPLAPTLSGILSSSIIAGSATTAAGEPSPAVTAVAVPAQATTAPEVPAQTDPAAPVPTPNVPGTVVTITTPTATGTGDTRAAEEIILVFPPTFTPPTGQERPAWPARQAQPAQPVQPAQPTTDTETAGTTPEPEKNIVLVNAEERIPDGEQAVLSPEQMIAPINGIIYYVPDEYTYRPEAAAAPAAPTNPTPETGNALPAGNPPAGRGLSPFTVPVINSMETGMYYVQVGAFNHPRSVENEIDRIGTAYPTVVQITGTESNPVYRVLLGPLSLGESGAMLQRFKSIGYKDAFIRSN